jgi:hypothetical protein
MPRAIPLNFLPTQSVTMVNQPRGSVSCRTARRGKAACNTATVVAVLLGLAASLSAQNAPDVHYLHQGTMQPGAIGSMQLARGGPLHGFFQPVEVKAPPGVSISLAEEGGFGTAEIVPLKVGLLIGQVYRIRVMDIPLQPGMEVFPTIEVIDRLYAPQGQERRFPIVIELSVEDLRLALEGKFVTRVIYLEDPRSALPVREDPDRQTWFEAPRGADPLAMADQLGRPMAILRMGARLPDYSTGPDMGFLFGCPPIERYEPDVKILPQPPKSDRTGANWSPAAIRENRPR